MATLLVIDDELPIRQNLARFLSLEGHQVLQAADGEAGLALALGEPRPDLVLCDVMMPRLNGYELLAALRADPRGRDLPFIFLSASAEKERLEQALEQGASGYVTKPFNLAQLKDVLARHLGPRP